MIKMEVLCMVDKQVIEEIKTMPTLWSHSDLISLQKAGRNWGSVLFMVKKPFFQRCGRQAVLSLLRFWSFRGVFGFIEEYQGVSFMEAVQLLGERVGFNYHACPVSQQASPHQALWHAWRSCPFLSCHPHDDKDGRRSKRLISTARIDSWCSEALPDWTSLQRETYLYQRLADRQFEEKDLLDSGLFYLSDGNQFYDTFFGRIIFPLTNDKGRVIAFSGRIWQKQIVRLPNIKIVARLQFLTRVTGVSFGQGKKREQVRLQSSIWWKASWMWLQPTVLV